MNTHAAMNPRSALLTATALMPLSQRLARGLAALGPDLRLAAMAAVLSGSSYAMARISRTLSAPWWQWARDVLIILAWDMAFFTVLVLCLGRLHRGHSHPRHRIRRCDQGMPVTAHDEVRRGQHSRAASA